MSSSPGASFPVIEWLSSEEISPNNQPKPPLVKLEATSSGPAALCHIPQEGCASHKDLRKSFCTSAHDTGSTWIWDSLFVPTTEGAWRKPLEFAGVLGVVMCVWMSCGRSWAGLMPNHGNGWAFNRDFVSGSHGPQQKHGEWLSSVEPRQDWPLDAVKPCKNL